MDLACEETAVVPSQLGNNLRPTTSLSFQTANTVIVITPNVFKNEVVKEALDTQDKVNRISGHVRKKIAQNHGTPRYEASVTTKKNAI